MMNHGEMADNCSMEEVQNDFKQPSSPPRKKIKTHDEASASQENAVNISESSVPTAIKYKIYAHEGGCSSILFPYNSQNLISGGKDDTVKIWDTSTGELCSILQGFQGSVYDLAISSENSFLVAALSSRKLCFWNLNTGQIFRTFTGHTQKVCAVDVGKVFNRHIVSAGCDHMIKVWDVQQDNPVCSRYVSSDCNAISFSPDETIICSGHANGKVLFSKISRFWVNQISEIQAHTQSVTSICPLQHGSLILSSGRDNWHNLIDTRTMQICSKFRTRCSRVASSWSRVCVSSDDKHAVVGSADGIVYVWSMQMGRMLNTLKGHSAPVLACSWSGMGRSLASSDSGGTVCIWS